MGAASTPARICPDCGTRNSGLSLFCAECGASLTDAATESSTDSQTTTTFTPVADSQPSDPYATQQFQPQVTGTDSPAAAPPWVEPGYAPVTGYTGDDIGSRGMVLGWIAGVLILLVIAYLSWTSFLDQATRDSIIGIFT
jgi:hypothetical protein